MTKKQWARVDQVSDDELEELRVEIADTMDDHDKVHKRTTRWRDRVFPKQPTTRRNSVVATRMHQLRSTADAEITTRSDDSELPRSASSADTEKTATTCAHCTGEHLRQFSPERFDSVQHSLGAILELACYLNKSPRTIWLALEGIFTDRQNISAPTLVRHRVSIFARLLPAAMVLLLLALVLLHTLLPNDQTGAGYTPVFSELGFLLFLVGFTTIMFFVLSTTMLMLKLSIQERFLHGFSSLITWSIPIVLSFLIASPEFLLLLQEVIGGASPTVMSLETILVNYADILATIYWTILIYASIYTGILFSFIAFSKVFQEQRDYTHRHQVLRDVIPLLVTQISTGPQRPRLYQVTEKSTN